jgi:hypothetical protein
MIFFLCVCVPRDSNIFMEVETDESRDSLRTVLLTATSSTSSTNSTEQQQHQQQQNQLTAQTCCFGGLCILSIVGIIMLVMALTFTLFADSPIDYNSYCVFPSSDCFHANGVVTLVTMDPTLHCWTTHHVEYVCPLFEIYLLAERHGEQIQAVDRRSRWIRDDDLLGDLVRLDATGWTEAQSDAVRQQGRARVPEGAVYDCVFSYTAFKEWSASIIVPSKQRESERKMYAAFYWAGPLCLVVGVGLCCVVDRWWPTVSPTASSPPNVGA